MITIGGNPYEMGLAHGRAAAASVRSYAEERMALAASASWSGREATRAEVLALAESCLAVHEERYPSLTEELRGVAAGAGVTPSELIVSGGFTDFVDVVAAKAASPGHANGDEDDCTALLVPGSRMSDGEPALAQTWDMHEGSANHLLLLEGRPLGKPAFIVMTTAGCLGMIGMNEVGVCVGINNLTAAGGRVGVTWPFVVRAMLEQESAAAALEVLRSAPLAGGHNYLVLDAGGAGANVEAMPDAIAAEALGDRVLVHTNHCLHEETKRVERPREAMSQAESERRLARARELASRGDMDVAFLQAITADPDAVCRVGAPPGHVGTCGAVVMRPRTRELWAVTGRPSEAPYARYQLGALTT